MTSPTLLKNSWHAENRWQPQAFVISGIARHGHGSQMTNSINLKHGLKSLFIPVCLILLLILPNLCSAQWPVTQQGHLLDANPRIGSMGINPNANLDALIPRINLVITGNITGGRRFQGDIPYRSVGEFSAELGSSLLSDFRRDSVGMANLSRGIATPQPYLDPSRSLTGFRDGRVARSHQAYQPTRIPPRTQGPGAVYYINQGVSLPSPGQSTYSPAYRSFGFGGLSGLSYPPAAPQTSLRPDTPLDLRYQSLSQNSMGLIQSINIPLQPQDLRIQSQSQTTTRQTSEQPQLTQDAAAETFLPDYQSQLQNYQTEYTEYINLFIQPWTYGVNRSLISEFGPAQTPPPPGRGMIVKPSETKPPPPPPWP